MRIVLVSNDLNVVSRVQGASTKIGATMRSVVDFEKAVAALSSEPADVVVLDLSTPQLDVDALVQKVRTGASEAARVIAFGPHVHAERLEAARAAGCDEVVSRGQFFAQLDVIFERCAGSKQGRAK